MVADLERRLDGVRTQPVPDRSAEIVGIDCFPLHLPMRTPVTTASHRVSVGKVLYVRVRARGGAEGWGEAGTDLTMSGETLGGMMLALDQFVRPALLGRSPFERVALSADLKHHLYGNGGIKAAVDMALLDLAGQISGLPAVDLLGGMRRMAAPVLRLAGGSGEVATDVAEVEALAGEGFRAFKLKAAIMPVEREAEIVNQLRDRLGPSVLLGIDANMGWSPAEARRFCNLAEGASLAFLEQPVHAGDTARLVQIAKSVNVPINADEALHGMHDIIALAAAGAIHGVSLKAVKFGGVTPLMTAASVADALGLSTVIATLVESNLASAAMLHAACAVPQIDWGLSLGCLMVADDPTEGRIECVAGLASCPTGPGLGVRVNESRLRDFAI